MKWFLKVLKQYADFKGRARRKEYWMFALFCFIIGLLTGGINGVLASTILGVSSLIGLALLIPAIAVSVRRLHDIGKSGWNYLFILIPLVGWIILLIWFCKDSQAGENKWGINPKQEVI